MTKTSIEKIIREKLAGFLEEHGLELYHTEYVKEGKDRYLRIFIDHIWQPGIDPDQMKGVSTEDCELVSRYISDILDDIDPIKEAYILEVSSPGMDRVLVKDKHFHRYEGKEVELSLYKAIDGRKRISGRLGKLNGGILEIVTDGGISLQIPMKSIAKSKLKIII